MTIDEFDVEIHKIGEGFTLALAELVVVGLKNGLPEHLMEASVNTLESLCGERVADKINSALKA